MIDSIAIIPARGGSKRIPQKNARLFLGVPAIERVVRTVKDSGVVARVIVSTDAPGIAELAEGAGAEIPGLRPSSLSDDHTPTIDVVRHALDAWCSSLDPESTVWVIYPTALLLLGDDLRSADERFRTTSPDFLVSLLRFPHPIERMLRLSHDGILRMVDSGVVGIRTQDLEPSFHDAGQFYIGSSGAWMSSTPLESPRSLGHELPRTSVVDIDEPGDWELAEALLRAREAPPLRDSR